MVFAMFAMVLLTTTVGVLAFIARVKSVKMGAVRAKSYRLMDSSEFPQAVTKTTRNFNNQFEAPVLFYIACTSYLALNLETKMALIMAWMFVLLRLIHAFIHVTYNNLWHRLIAFWAAFLTLLGLWIELVRVSALN